MSYQFDLTKLKSFPSFKKRFLSFLPESYHQKDKNICWFWLGAKTNDGYGKISYSGELYLAHRISYIIFNGPVLSNQLVRHICDNPSCVNPNHLLLGNNSNNLIDMIKRNPRKSIILNEEAVKVIKWMLKYQYEKGLCKKLALLYKVSPATITKIKKGYQWSWVII